MIRKVPPHASKPLAFTPPLSRTSAAHGFSTACGTGHYSRLLLSWGAASVIDVDVSPAMVAAAAREAQSFDPEIAKRLSFSVGDVASLGKRHDEGFDLAIGAWLLHFAGD